MLLEVLFNILGYIFAFIYQISTLTNLRLLRRKIAHRCRRYLKILVYKLCGRILQLTSSPCVFKSKRHHVNERKLSLFLSDVLDATNIWWNARACFLFPYISFEEWVIGEVYGKGIVDVRYVGSYRETIASLHYSTNASDIDIMYIYREFDVCGKNHWPTDIEKDKCINDSYTGFNTRIIDAKAPGYVYVQVTKSVPHVVNSFKSIATKGEFHASLKVEELIDYFEKYVICNPNCEVSQGSSEIPQKSESYFLKSDGFTNMHEKFNRERFTGWLLFQQCGPASKIFWNTSGLPQRIKIGQLDMVFALHSPHWPEQAKEWLTRNRKFGYPCRKSINEIRAYGVDIVPKSSETELAFEWRLSFSVAEVKLVCEWNDAQKSCYRILKTFHTDYLSRLGITSYSIKNIMFYLIEQTTPRVWKPTKLVTCLFLALKRLKDAVRSNFCPHYFIKKNNLFRGIESRNLQEAALFCERLLSDIYGQIWISDGLWFEICAREMDSYFYSLQEKTDESQKAHDKHVRNKLEQKENFWLIFKIYYSVKVHKEISKMFLNASLSKHYHENTVLVALSQFIRNNFKKTSDCFEYDLIYCQVAWAYTKCLYWLNRKQGNTIASKSQGYTSDVKFFSARDTLSYMSEVLQEESIKKTTDTISGEVVYEAMRAVNFEFAQQIWIASQILLGKHLVNVKALSNATHSINDGIPVVVCPLDRVSEDKNIADFQYKNLAYYCPLEKLIFYACLKNGSAIPTEMAYDSSLDKLNLLKITYARQFCSIIYPFPKHLQKKIDLMLQLINS